MPSPKSDPIPLVVYAEDMDSDARLVERMLKEGPYRLHRVKTIKELIDYGRDQVPDVILLDLRLPDSPDSMTTVLRVVRHFPSSAIVAISTYDDHEFLLNARQAGATDYLAKGAFDQTVLMNTIKSAFTFKRWQLPAQSSNNLASVQPFTAKEVVDAIQKLLVSHGSGPVVSGASRSEPDVSDVITPAQKFVKWGLNNWKAVGFVLTMITWITTQWDTYVQDREINAEFRANISKAIESNQEAVDEVKNAVAKQKIITVKSVEQLQREIRAVAPPGASLPEDPPELRAAKREVNEFQQSEELRRAREELFDEVQAH